MVTEALQRLGELPAHVGVCMPRCKNCETVLPVIYVTPKNAPLKKKITSTNEVSTPLGVFNGPREAAKAHGITPTAARSRIDRGSHGWALTGEKVPCEDRVIFTKEVSTPLGVFNGPREAAQAHGITLGAAWDRIERGSHGWVYTGKRKKAKALVPSKRQKFCSDKCRDSWHSMYRENEPRNTRIQFALTVLRFMEKQFPDQTVKMRTGFDRKRKEKNE